jgi:hypothetical protein
MKIAIIILNYNSSSDCRKCIGFLQKQEGIETEIVVVDNCSPKEGELDAIQRLCIDMDCTFIPAKENRGYNAGNNIGLRYASEKGYKYALIANPDMEFPQTDYLKKMVEVMEKDDDIVVCGSDIIESRGIHQNPMMRDGDWKSSFGWLKDILGRKRVVDSYDFIDNYKECHYCAKVSGCCLMVRLSYMQYIGYFDEHVFLYCEEAILSRQVERDEKKMYYLADTQAIHRHISSDKGDPVKQYKSWGVSRRYFEEKYNDEGWFKNWIKRMNRSLYECAFEIHCRLK